MKKGLLFIILCILLVNVVYGLQVDLIFPLDNGIFIDKNAIPFRCKVIGEDLVELRLYTNITGTWKQDALVSNPANGSEIVFTVNNIANGMYTWNCKAISGNGIIFANNNRTFSVSIMPNNPPQFSASIPNQTWNEDTAKNNAFDLDNYFSDVDNDRLTYTFSGSNNINVNINSNGLVSFSQPSNWFGIENIIFTASDGKGGSVSSNIVRLTVNNVDGGNPSSNTSVTNTAPEIIKVIQNQTKKQGVSSWTLDLSGYASDSEDNEQYLNWSVSNIDLDLFDVQVDNNHKELKFIAVEEATGSDEIIITVKDTGGLTDSQKILVSIEEKVDEEFKEEEIPDVKSFSPKDTNLELSGEQIFQVGVDKDVKLQWYLSSKKLEGETMNAYALNSADLENGTYNLTVVLDKDGAKNYQTWIVKNIAQNLENVSIENKISGAATKTINKEKYLNLIKSLKEKWKIFLIIVGILVLIIIIFYLFKKRARKINFSSGQKTLYENFKEEKEEVKEQKEEDPKIQELKTKISDYLRFGYSRDRIERVLLSKGYNLEQIKKGFENDTSRKT